MDDRNLDVMRRLSKDLFGKLFGDKGYLSAKLFEHLHQHGVTLITKVKKNIKNVLTDLFDYYFLDAVSSFYRLFINLR